MAGRTSDWPGLGLAWLAGATALVSCTSLNPAYRGRAGSDGGAADLTEAAPLPDVTPTADAAPMADATPMNDATTPRDVVAPNLGLGLVGRWLFDEGARTSVASTTGGVAGQLRNGTAWAP